MANPKAEAARNLRDPEDWVGGIKAATYTDAEGQDVKAFTYEPESRYKVTQEEREAWLKSQQDPNVRKEEEAYLGIKKEETKEEPEYAVGGMTPQEHMDMLKGYTPDSAAYRDAVVADFEETMYEHGKLLEEALSNLENWDFTQQENNNVLNDIKFYKDSIEGLGNEIKYIEGIDEAQFRLRMQTLDKVK